MASSWHTTIPKLIKSILKDYAYLRKGYYTIEEEKVIKISDPTPGSKSMIEYSPDFVFKRNLSASTEFYVIFEVISDQSDIKTMADIARVLACRNIRRAIFVPTSKEKKEETDRIVNTLKGWYKKRFKKTSKDDVIDIISLDIFKLNNKSELLSEEEIKEVILKYIKDLLPAKEKK